ncbi:MAG: hypothetical protein ACK56L_05195, partial [Pseudanabaena sp.]
FSAALASLLALLRFHLFLIYIPLPFFYPLSPFSLISSVASSLCFGIIIKISLLKARRWRAYNKLIFVFQAPTALETLKSISTIKL